MESKISAIKKAFGLCGAGASDTKRRVARYSRGNVRLQLGHVMTAGEYEAQKRRVLSHDFR